MSVLPQDYDYGVMRMWYQNHTSGPDFIEPYSNDMSLIVIPLRGRRIYVQRWSWETEKNLENVNNLTQNHSAETKL